MTVEEVQKIIDEVDENRDGKLNYREVFLYNTYVVSQRNVASQTYFSNNCVSCEVVCGILLLLHSRMTFMLIQL